MKPENLSDKILDVFDGICYTTDLEGVILHIGPSQWDAFATDNNANQLTYNQVIGSNIFEYIKGPDVKANLKEIFDLLHTGKHSKWIAPYRCDSPGEKRNMRLSISVVRDKGEVTGYLFQSILLEAETRPPIDLFDFNEISAILKDIANRPFISMCSYCQKVKDENHTHGKWLEAEEYYHEGGDANVAISHTICEVCLASAPKHFVS